MTEINETTPILPELVAAEVLGRTSQLLHSTSLQSRTFTRPLANGGGELAEIVIGEESKTENPHVLLSTHGLGGAETTGKVTITTESGENEYEYHTELYTVADTTTSATLYAEELARLAFFVADTQQPLMPGSIISLTDDKGEAQGYFFTENPIGIQEGHRQPPVLSTAGFAVFNTCVTKLYGDETTLLQTPENVDLFFAYLKNLGTEAYAYNREAFTAPTTAEDSTPTE